MRWTPWGCASFTQIIRELVQNTFDEEETICGLRISEEPEGVLIVLRDDGPGFQDSHTLMGGTSKRMDPEKRGRFNLGDQDP